MNFVNLILLLGVVGLLGSTVGNSVLAWIISRVSLKDRDLGTHAFAKGTLRIDVLIPCHNEEALIQKTLDSITEAKLYFGHQSHEINITVGLDHCTDLSEDRINRFIYDEATEVRMIGNPHAAGKWNMLRELVRQSDADWVALVDAGALWDQKLLMKSLRHFLNGSVMGIAPSYGAVKAGWVERLNWGIERVLKSIESSAGGPISVHGATVFYKREFLVKALAGLEGTAWLNDDVVIPLTLRTLFPRQKIVYLSNHPAGKAWVTDLGVKEGALADFARRRRMLAGNLQWIRALFVKAFRSDISVGIIAARRVFRTFWAYAVLCLGLGLAVHAVTSAHTLSTLVMILGFACAFAVLYRMRAAFWAGLQIPFQLYKIGGTPSENLWN